MSLILAAWRVTRHLTRNLTRRPSDDCPTNSGQGPWRSTHQAVEARYHLQSDDDQGVIRVMPITLN